MAADGWRLCSPVCRSWMVAFGAFWVNFCIMGVQRSTAVIFVALLDALEVTRQAAAWPSGLFVFFMCITGPLSGYMSRYRSIRVLVLCGAGIASAGLVLCFFARDILYVQIFYGACQGLGLGVVVPLVPVILNQRFSRHRAAALGFAYAGSSVGSFVIPPLTEWLLETYGLRGTFLLLGAITAQAMPGAALFAPRQKPTAGPLALPDPPKADIPEDRDKANLMTHTLDIVTHPMFVVIATSFSVYFMASAIYLTVVVDFAGDRHVSSRASPFIISAFSLGDLAARLGSGWISDLHRLQRRHLAAACMGTMGVLLAVVPLATGYVAMVSFSASLGLMNGAIVIHLSVLLEKYLGLVRLPLALGYFTFVNGAAACARPALVGHFRDVVGSYDYLFMTVGVLQVATALLWLVEPLVRSSDSLWRWATRRRCDGQVYRLQ